LAIVIAAEFSDLLSVIGMCHFLRFLKVPVTLIPSIPFELKIGTLVTPDLGTFTVHSSFGFLQVFVLELGTYLGQTDR